MRCAKALSLKPVVDYHWEMLVQILASVALNVSFAEPKVRCDFESLTKNCTVFSPDGPTKIPMPDGKSFLPNYTAFVRNLKSNPALLARQAQEVKDSSEKEKSQSLSTIASILDEVPSRLMSPIFKFRLMQTPALLPNDKPVDTKHEEKVLIAWPPESTVESEQRLNVAQVKYTLSKILNEDQMNRLKVATVRLEESSSAVEKFTNNAINPLASETSQLSVQRKQEVADIAEKARQSAIDNIVQGRKDNELSQAEAAAVAKLRTVEYIDGDQPQVIKSPWCKGIVANAFYNEDLNTIQVCPSLYAFPDTAIATVIGHEFGHPVDNCEAQFPVYKINANAIHNLAPNGKIPNEIVADPQLLKTFRQIVTLRDSGAKQTAHNFLQHLSDPKKLDYFIEKGVLTLKTPKPPEITQSGNTLNGYVLADVYRCLSEKLGFRQVSEADIEKFADSVVQEKLSIADDSYDPVADRITIIEAYKRFPQCISPEKKSQMTEAIADTFGAKFGSEFLTTQKPSNELERLAPIGFFASVVCLLRSTVQNESPRTQSTDATVEKVKGILKMGNDEHPNSKSRVDKILLASPEFREAMGCIKQNYPQCAHHVNKNAHPDNPERTEQ